MLSFVESIWNHSVIALVLNRLIHSINYFPWIITGVLEARGSANRIQEFLYRSSTVRLDTNTAAAAYALQAP